MPVTDTSIYKERDEILAEMLAELLVAIPDAYTGDDGITRIIYEIQAGQFENLFLATQLLLEDMFISTASYQALIRHGEQYGLPMKPGVQATGTLQFEGAGGTYVAIGTECAYAPGGGIDPIFYETSIDGTIPNPGVPGVPTLAAGAAGALNGSYEYAVTYVTADGETALSPNIGSIAVVNTHVLLSNISIGGAGVTARKIYRDKNGAGNYRLVTTLANNVTTVYDDNIADATVAANPAAPTVDTAHRLTLSGRAQDVGVEGNTIIGTVNELTNADIGITGVTNPTAFTGGEDQEDSEEYRQRLLAFIQNPETGSPADIKAWAESVPGVETATVFENDPVAGTVTVRISGPDGSIPSAGVIADVQAVLDERDYANITIVVTTFTALSTNVTVDVTVTADTTLAAVTPSVQTAVTNYINNLEVGETLRISGIVDAVFGLTGVADVVVTTPSSNQTTPATQKRTPGTITVT